MSDSEDSEDEKKPEVVKERGSSDSSYDEEETQDVAPRQEEKRGETLVELAEQRGEEKMTSSTSQHHPPPQPPPQPRRKRFIPKYDVEGTYRLVLSDETQTAIEMFVGIHVNSQYPWKEVEKAKIMEGIQIGGELSEFFSLKELLEAYEEPLILMGYIPDESKDEDEFYVCLTKEARDHCKQQSDKFIRRQEKKLEKSIQKKPRPWTSHGSDVEIIKLRPVYARPLMEIEVKASFPTLYDPYKFSVRDTNACRDGYIELTPYRQKFNNVYLRRVDMGIQAALDRVDKVAQTELRYPKNMWTQSIADAMGSFVDTGDDVQEEDLLKDEDVEDESSDEDGPKKPPADEVGLETFKAAFKRLRRLSYVKNMNSFMREKEGEMDSILELNTVMDIYCNDYPNLMSEKVFDSYDSMSFEEYICFTDVRAKDKCISCATFHPMWSGIVAVSYSDGSPNIMKSIGTRPDPIKRAVYGLNPVMIWSHIDSLIPKLYLECTREVKILAFCPFDENLLIGGCINGQIVVWDLTGKLDKIENVENLSETREKYRIAMNAHMGWMKQVQDDAVVPATVMSNLLTSHYGTVNAIKWHNPNFVVSPTGKQFFLEDGKKSQVFLTAAEDGTILIWNLAVECMTMTETKKVRKSKRVTRRPSGLMVDFSPYKVWDRNLMPCYRIIIGIAGHPQTMPIQTLTMKPLPLKYIYTPLNNGRGRRYFKCEILPQTENDMSSNIYCGSVLGEVKKVSWEGHAFNTGETVNSEYCDVKYSCNIHDGVIYCTSKNPFVHSIVLTLGGKIFAIWHDKHPGRPLLWKKRPCRLTDAVWSLYKPSLIFIVTADGTIETWDLLLRSDQPIAIQTVSGSMLTGISVHFLPIQKNMIGVGDQYGSFRMFIDPPIFMINNPSYVIRMENMVARELKVMMSFMAWQNKWMKNNPHILLEMKRKEGLLLAEKEEERRKMREEEEKRLEAEAEAKRLERMRVIGPEERWQRIIQKLIERTIAVKKRINRAELIENEKPLRELETQRLEKERRMFEIMKNQKNIFNDTVAILFPEAIRKPPKPKKTYFTQDKNILKKEYLADYEYLKKQAFKTVEENPYIVGFSWDTTVREGRERREALNAEAPYINIHRCRLEEEKILNVDPVPVEPPKIVTDEEEKEEEGAE